MLCEFGAAENLLETADKSGNTPLLTAVKHDQTQIVTVLVQFSCNLFARNLRGDTVLHTAALHNSQAVIPILASFITEEMFALRNRDGMTAQDIATSLQNISFARSLQVILRNMTVKNALSEREIAYPTSRPHHLLSRSNFRHSRQRSDLYGQEDADGPESAHKSEIISQTELMMAARRSDIQTQRPSFAQVQARERKA